MSFKLAWWGRGCIKSMSRCQHRFQMGATRCWRWLPEWQVKRAWC